MTHSHLESARQRLARMRAALAAPTPESINECLPGLAEAADLLGRVEQELASGGPRDIVMEMHELRREIGAVKRLVARGAAFYKGWAQILGVAVAAGYTAAGEAATIAPAGTISVRG
jgi:hypothetical protein